MAPAIKNILPYHLELALRFVKSTVPEFTTVNPTFANVSYRNLAILEALDKDPYFYKDKRYFATWYTLINTMSECPQTFKNYKCPFLAIQGGTDKVVSPMGVFELYEQSPLSEDDKDIIFIEDMWHAIWHDPEIHGLIEKVREWIDKRMTQR